MFSGFIIKAIKNCSFLASFKNLGGHFFIYSEKKQNKNPALQVPVISWLKYLEYNKTSCKKCSTICTMLTENVDTLSWGSVQIFQSGTWSNGWSGRILTLFSKANLRYIHVSLPSIFFLTCVRHRRRRSVSGVSYLSWYIIIIIITFFTLKVKFVVLKSASISVIITQMKTISKILWTKCVRLLCNRFG